MRERPKEALRFDGSTKLRADEQKHHLRRRSEARRPNASKPSDLKTTVNDAVAQGRFMLLSGEICFACSREPTSKETGLTSLGLFAASSNRSEIDENRQRLRKQLFR